MAQQKGSQNNHPVNQNKNQPNTRAKTVPEQLTSKDIAIETKFSTKKPEDMVHTALFNADWDVNAAFDIIMEQPDDLGGWEETGKAEKKKETT